MKILNDKPIIRGHSIGKMINNIMVKNVKFLKQIPCRFYNYILQIIVI